jgi:hypothetical protein
MFGINKKRRAEAKRICSERITKLQSMTPEQVLISDQKHAICHLAETNARDRSLIRRVEEKSAVGNLNSHDQSRQRHAEGRLESNEPELVSRVADLAALQSPK